MPDATTTDTEELCKSLAGILGPFIGDAMAHSSVKAHRDRLGLTTPVISREQGEALITRLGNGLVVFIGRDRAMQTVVEMKRVLSRQGGGR